MAGQEDFGLWVRIRLTAAAWYQSKERGSNQPVSAYPWPADRQVYRVKDESSQRATSTN